MDMIQSTLLRYYKYNSWSCGDTYETLEWNDVQRSRVHINGLIRTVVS